MFAPTGSKPLLLVVVSTPAEIYQDGYLIGTKKFEMK
jgi:hypothetical protein